MFKFVRSVALGLALAAGLAAASPTRLLACDTAVGSVTGRAEFGGIYGSCDDAAASGKWELENFGDIWVGYRVTEQDAQHWELTLYK